MLPDGVAGIPAGSRAPAGAGAGREGWAALGPGERVIALGILLGALVARLAFALLLPLEIRWSDAREFEQMGRYLYQEGNFSYWTQRAPGYSAFIAAVYHLIGGPDLRVLRIVEAVLATGAVAVLGLLGVRFFGRRAGLIAMALAAFHPLLAFMPSTQYSESLMFVAMMLTLLAAYSAWRSGNPWLWVLTGLLVGIQTLIRPNAITFLPGLGLGFIVLLRRARRGWLVPALLTILATGAVVTPWMVRCHRIYHRWFFVATGAGRAFWLGNNENATLVTSELPYFDPHVWTAADSAGDAIDKDRFFMAEARRFIREHPGRAAVGYAIRLRNLFALYPDPATRAYADRRSALAQGFASVVIFAGALLGLGRLRATPALLPLVLGTISFVLPTAMAYTNVRYRLFFEPCLLLLAGVGWAWLLGRVQPARPPAGAR